MEIEVFRPKEFADKIRNYQLWADDKKIAIIKPNSTQVVTLPEGTKNIRATIDWCSSPEFLVSEIKSGKLIVRNSFTGSFFKSIFWPFYSVTFGKEKYLKIESGI